MNYFCHFCGRSPCICASVTGASPGSQSTCHFEPLSSFSQAGHMLTNLNMSQAYTQPAPSLHQSAVYYPTHPSAPGPSSHHTAPYTPFPSQHAPPGSLPLARSNPTPTPLTSVISSAPNEPQRASGPNRGQKRKGLGPETSSAKRHRGVITASTAAASSSSGTASRVDDGHVFGVGPCRQSPVQVSESEPAPSRYGSLLQTVKGSNMATSRSAATDVWCGVVPASSEERPARLPTPESLKMLKKRPSPDVSHMACSFCLKQEEPVWHVWQNADGQTDAIRTHFGKYHPEKWLNLIIAEKLKGYETAAKKLEEVLANGIWTLTKPKGAAGQQRSAELFTLDGFYDRLVRWIAVDDQSMNVLDCPELRDLLLYIGTDLTDSDIPHRTKLGELISKRFQIEYAKMVVEIENSLGRVSFTSDLWTAQNSKSFMAVTAHYCAMDQRQLVLRSHLVAFRHVSGSHTGANLAKHFFEILQEIRALQRIGMITLDNASNCHTMMQDLKRLLNNEGISFDAEGNRIRCFPHVVNIAVQTGLKHLTQVDGSSPGDELTEVLKDNLEYLQILQSDIVSSARQLVTACRASGQRREDLSSVVQKGFETGEWTREELRDVALLRDVITRWSSIYLMIDRLLELYPAISKLMEIEKHKELRRYKLSNEELKVLNDIRLYLAPFHIVQEVVSAEKTPTLSIVLPLYEQLLEHVSNAKSELPLLAHAMDESIRKLDEYLAESRKTRIYALAIVLNPTLKFDWIERRWSVAEVKAAQEWVKNSMLVSRKHIRTQESRQATLSTIPALPSTSVTSLDSIIATTPTTPVPTPSVSSPSVLPISTRMFCPIPTPSPAARAQTSGVARLKMLSRSYSSSSLSAASHSRPATPQEDAAVEERLAEQDRLFIELELEKYRADGIITGDEVLADFDILLYWQMNKHTYPLLYCLALDVLPVQASAVPCERVFSSGKDTDSARRSNLSAETMETLQILKFLFRYERLSFENNWCDTEDGILATELDSELGSNLLHSY